eukprot:TRINITY_DN931_c0_g1_i1.p1 TRINITY_DN931_c0_g1~~TRINITY_DN931_c0_g1_i1.p1  ORF type:complete len:768 (-),score=258.48 TRINITY_DN931_c0_g1_i1:179-2428(-)
MGLKKMILGMVLMTILTITMAVYMPEKMKTEEILELNQFSFTKASKWEEAAAKAQKLISTFSTKDKVDLATGVGWMKGYCVGNIPAIKNFPGLCLQDSPTGVRFAQDASAFPAGINAASTWDRKLIFERSKAMGEEYRGKGVHCGLTPMMNIGRVAAGGRNWEGFGADPFLAGQAAVSSILGIQSQGVMANAKHYIGNEQEHMRTTSSSNIDDRTIHEVYSLPFLYSVKAGVVSIMCSYNLVNGTHACENDRTLNEILKKEFGFKGFVMSDWDATHSTEKAVNAGLDMSMPGDQMGGGIVYFGQRLLDAVNAGKVSMDRLNDIALRILTPYFLLGQDKNFPPVSVRSFTNDAPKVDVQGNHKDIIRKVGADSNILLKNVKNALPLSNTPGKKIAVIGEDARNFFGSQNPCGNSDHDCDSGTLAQGWGSGTTNFPYLISPADAIRKRASSNSQSVKEYSQDNDVRSGAAAALGADVAIVFGNADSGEAYITVDGNQGDRNDLNLFKKGDDLVQAVASVNKNTIVVIHTVGPVLMSWADHPNITAIIVAGLPGQESGNALVDVLYGDVNPSGKLVYTIAKQRSDYPADVSYTNLQIDYKEGLFVDYRHFDAKNITPAFPFGFGLSYTTFRYFDLSVSPVAPIKGLSPMDISTTVFRVQFKISNTGSRDGKEAAQLYLGFPQGTNEPPKILRGFTKVSVPKGRSVSATISIHPLELAIWDVLSQKWTIPTGVFKVYVGSSSRNIELNGSFRV